MAPQLWNWTVALPLFSAQSLLNRRHSIAKSNCIIYVILEQTKWSQNYKMFFIISSWPSVLVDRSYGLFPQSLNKNIFICSHCQKIIKMSWHSSENVFCWKSSWKIRKHVKRYKGLLRDVTDIYHLVGEQGGKLNWYISDIFQNRWVFHEFIFYWKQIWRQCRWN